MHQIQDSLQQLHVRLSNLLARGDHWHIHTLSLKGDYYSHVYLCEDHDSASVSAIFLLDFGTGLIIYFSFYFISCLCLLRSDLLVL
jgi:hypothetical protein